MEAATPSSSASTGASGASTTITARVIAAVLDGLPGLEQEIGQVVRAIHGFAGALQLRERRPVRGLVVEGPSGTGKTSMARAGARVPVGRLVRGKGSRQMQRR